MNVYRDQIVWGRSPVRIDLAGGWTDTPPYCLYAGGNVVNVAIELNGQPPLQVYIKPSDTHKIILRSIDLGAMEVISSWDELRDYNKVGSPFSIPKAALALAENLDWNIGRVLSLLHSLDLEQETIVIYFSDNGPNSFRWNGGMKGRKGSTDEGGVRSPFCIRWPGHIRKGAVETQLSGAIDLIPTLLGLAGIEYTPLRKLDGIDWGQRLLDEKAPAIDRVLYSYWGGKTSVRISYYLLDAEDHLYKTDIDREQRKDVSDKEPEIYERMKRYSNWFKDELLADFPKKDTRPFIIGHPRETYSKLPARDARISGPIERSNRYPNCSILRIGKARKRR